MEQEEQNETRAQNEMSSKIKGVKLNEGQNETR